MRIPSTSSRSKAFTRLELFAVISIIVVLLSMLVLALTKPRTRTAMIKCSSNLKQIALAANMFATDNGGSYPFGVTNSIAYQDTNSAWRHFLVMSNELGMTKLLICWEDRERMNDCAIVFGEHTDSTLPSVEGRKNATISYFIALRAQREQSTNSRSILFGDRNIFIQGRPLNGSLLKLKQGDQIQWDSRLHTNIGNIVHTDGSVSSLIKKQTIEESPPVDLLLPLAP